MHPQESYLVLYNIMKQANFGFLLRTATAFGVAEIIIIGKRAFEIGGACGTANRTPKRHFHKLPEAVEYLRQREVAICGVEISADAIPIQQCRFPNSTAFMVGNEGVGLTESQNQFCDFRVYIPQYGAVESINVNVAAGIVLHHFAIRAGHIENSRADLKFEFAKRPKHSAPKP